ncbi:MAG: hypothetical protein V7641_3695 [Blastocatellia bacterium]
MAARNVDENDIQSLASLLADIEGQLNLERDQSELLRLTALRQQCLLELARMRPGQQTKDD